ncbi:T6SS phospholipase effector Tle1-like catalytic domain-containing protein [Flexithrix dorotheae]|uniref:phospholipase effector Tle1 domain-containing protein n=1 Tax=Flexithrix dorotheae TaxID=70993 RepID=UPI0003644AE2|nr:DUF2235 domain-containing protein [Flexithrix dorotheae]
MIDQDLNLETIHLEYTKDFNAQEKERKHIILIDGTWNDETGVGLDGLVTNIVQLQRILKNDEEKQIVRYHRGVGNDDDNGFLGNLIGGATGRGVEDIVERAYVRFVQDWQKGDKICVFGFSRGAAAARMLAAKICKEGVPKSIKIDYMARENKATKVVEQFMSKFDLDTSRAPFQVEVDFVGVWDTVSAFGLFNNLQRFLGKKEKDLFTDNYIADNIKRAVHLLAMDETRRIFVPSLMNQIEDKNHNSIENKIHEVWFPGVHSDIGGSYKEDEIAKVSLYYMLKKFHEYVNDQGYAPLLIDEEMYKKRTLITTQRAHFHFFGLSRGEGLRHIKTQVHGMADPVRKPKIHRLYYDLCGSHQTFSVVPFGKVTRPIKFQYMPFNVKTLRGNFEIVD